MDENLLALCPRQMMKEFCCRIDQLFFTTPTSGIQVGVQILCPILRFVCQRFEWGACRPPKTWEQVDEDSDRIDTYGGGQMRAWHASLKQQRMSCRVMRQQLNRTDSIPDPQGLGFVHALVVGPLHL